MHEFAYSVLAQWQMFQLHGHNKYTYSYTRNLLSRFIQKKL